MACKKLVFRRVKGKLKYMGSTSRTAKSLGVKKKCKKKRKRR